MNRKNTPGKNNNRFKLPRLSFPRRTPSPKSRAQLSWDTGINRAPLGMIQRMAHMQKVPKKITARCKNTAASQERHFMPKPRLFITVLNSTA